MSMERTIIAKLRESETKKLSEALLNPAKVGWYGNSNPKLPDGTPELIGGNKAITVSVIGEMKKYAVVALMGEGGEDLLQKILPTKESAIQLAEKLLKEIKDPMYDAQKVAKKYHMDYHRQ